MPRYKNEVKEIVEGKTVFGEQIVCEIDWHDALGSGRGAHGR